MRTAALLLAAAALGAAPAAAPAWAQERAAARAALAIAPRHGVDSVAPAGDGLALPGLRAGRARPPNAWWTPLASAAIPGAGQAALGQDRFVAYLAIEGYAWLRYRADVTEGRRQRRVYRALAADVARALFGGPRPVGDFDYYERMEHYVESGVYDVDPSTTILDPESDTATYNGAIWLLARRTYWDDPNTPPDPASSPYIRALAFYEARAVTPEFRWSWRDRMLEHDLYRRTIARSNDAFRSSIQDLGFVIANHVLSMIDAYITLRLERETTDPSRVGIRAALPWPVGGPPMPADGRR